MRRTRIKICCMQSEEEARLAIAAGADALGLVGAMPSGPGPIDDALIAAIAAARAAAGRDLPADQRDRGGGDHRPCQPLPDQYPAAGRSGRARRLSPPARGPAGHQAGPGDARRRRGSRGRGDRRSGPCRCAAARFRPPARGGQGAGRHRPDPRLGDQPRDRRRRSPARCSSPAACAPDNVGAAIRAVRPVRGRSSAPACAGPTTASIRPSSRRSSPRSGPPKAPRSCPGS